MFFGLFRGQLKKELDSLPQTKAYRLKLAVGGALIFALMAIGSYSSPTNPCTKQHSLMCFTASLISTVTGTSLETGNWLIYALFSVFLLGRWGWMRFKTESR